MHAANTSRTPIAAMMPRGMSRFGSLVSSAASGTPSTARKNQMRVDHARPTKPNPVGRKPLDRSTGPA